MEERQSMNLAADVAAGWIELSREVLNQAAQLSASTAQHVGQINIDMHSTSLRGLQELQSNAWRWASMWPQAFQDPFRWYQRVCEETTEAVSRSVELARNNAEQVVASLQRLQTSTERTARALQGTFEHAAERAERAARAA
jgi:uncharacterized damage-inducible protein DinB